MTETVAFDGFRRRKDGCKIAFAPSFFANTQKASQNIRPAGLLPESSALSGTRGGYTGRLSVPATLQMI